MRKTVFIALAFAFSFTLAQAQEDPVKLAKQAGRALTSYNMDPSGSAAKLDEAKMKIDQALQAESTQGLVSAWQTKGEVYSTIVQRDMMMRQINPAAKLSGDNDALVAFEAFEKAYNLATKKFEKSDAAKGITEIQGYLVNIGLMKYEAKAYDKAYRSFDALVRSHDILSAEKLKSYLDDPEQYQNQLYVAALCAQLAHMNDEAERYYMRLYEKGNAQSAVYEGLYQIKTEKGDEAAAERILKEGRQKYPNDSGLLFSEINLYLKKGELDGLIARLKQAIEQEPNNLSLYITLGSVYDNLYQREIQAKNNAKAAENFAEAKKYYEKAIEIDPKAGDAYYSLGALYYNKAAARTQDLNALPQDDYSAATIKKYQQIQKEIMALFDEALPYFQKSEALNPNDTNTLIALSEIYARKDELEMANEFKKRLEVVRGGGKNTQPYFKM
jgi:tetratricopeptide (TPR) repeat protein